MPVRFDRTTYRSTLLLLAVAACSGDEPAAVHRAPTAPLLARGDAEPMAAAYVAVTPGSASLAAGSTAQLTATYYNKKGAPAARTFTWTSSAPAVASVSANGLVTAVAPGTATIRAATGGVSGTSAITVTGSPPPTGEVLLAAGDIAVCGTAFDEATAAILDGQVGTIAALGDLAYNSGTSAEFANCYDPSWGRHKSRTRPAVGNHEYQTTGASPYYAYFGASAGDPTKGYYSYDLGAWHIVVLNSNCSVVSCAAGSPQESWLRADLAATTRACILAYWHHPRFSSDATHANNTGVAPFWDALYQAGADVVLNGHAHVYERFAPQTPAAVASSAGIRQFVVGTGGRSPFYSWGTIKANSEVRNNATHGVLKLSLGATSYAWSFLPIAGSTWTDAGTQACH